MSADTGDLRRGTWETDVAAEGQGPPSTVVRSKGKQQWSPAPGPRSAWLVPMSWPRVAARLFPVFGWLDLRVYVRMDLEQVQQVATRKKLQGLVFRELK